MTQVHSTAIVDPQAELDPTVSVGPYAVIGPHVRVGAGTTIGAHCVIEGRTTIGRDNRIFQFASLGAVPQDKKYAGEPTELVIGDRNTIREFCTFNIGVPGAGGVTRVGNDNWIMAYTHIAHDCQRRRPHHARQQHDAGRPRAPGRLGDGRRADRHPPVRARSARTR